MPTNRRFPNFSHVHGSFIIDIAIEDVASCCRSARVRADWFQMGLLLNLLDRVVESVRGTTGARQAASVHRFDALVDGDRRDHGDEDVPVWRKRQRTRHDEPVGDSRDAERIRGIISCRSRDPL